LIEHVPTIRSRHWLIVAVVLNLLVAGSTTAAGQNDGLTIRLLGEVTLNSSTVLLRQIAEISGRKELVDACGALPVADDLSGGRTTVVRAWKLGELLGKAGHDLGKITITGSAACKIRIVGSGPKDKGNVKRRRSGETAGGVRDQFVSPSRSPRSLEARLRKMIHDNIRSLPRRARIKISFNQTVESLLAMTDPPYTFKIARKRRNGRWLGLLTFNVEVVKDGRSLQKVPILVKVEAEAPVLIARKTINSKARISEQDLEQRWRRIGRLDRKVLTELEKACGQRARRMISAGTVLTGDMLEPLPMVKRGQLVTVIYRGNGFEIKTVGRAMRTGFADQTISVRNERSKQMYEARLVGPGLAVIEAQPGTAGANQALVDAGNDRNARP